MEDHVAAVSMGRGDLDDSDHNTTFSMSSSKKGVYRMVMKLFTGVRVMSILTAEEEVLDKILQITS